MATEETTLEVKNEDDIIEEDDATKVDPDSSQDDDAPETGDEPEDGDEIIEPAPVSAPQAVKEVVTPHGQLVRQPDETDREWALRLENKRLRDANNKDRNRDIIDPQKPPVITQVKKPSEVLAKYKPEDLQALREVLPELATEMGYVRRDELAASSYDAIANEQIELFFTDHPEYTAEKDPDGTLWNRLKEEYQSFYKPPANPKDFKKIFERIHRDVFGIEPKGPLPKVTAAREKIQVASHGPNSAPAAPRTQNRKTVNTALRTDMLKGFSPEAIADIEARAQE